MILDKCSILRSHFAWLCVLFWTQFLFARSFHVCFVGGTNFGFMNGANGLRPTTTSYGMSMTVFEIWWKLNYFNHVHIRLILVGGKCGPISKQARISIKWYVFLSLFNIHECMDKTPHSHSSSHCPPVSLGNRKLSGKLGVCCKD